MGLIGILLHSGLAGRCYTDRKIAIRHRAPSADVFVATVNMRRQIIYACAQLCSVLLGVVSMTIPESSTATTTASIIASFTIIAEEVLLIVNALWDNQARQVAKELLRK